MDPSESYLPPFEPVDNPPEKQQRTTRKTLALWLVLILFTVAIYQLIAPPHSSHRRSRSPASESCQQTGWSTPAALVPPVLLCLVMGLWLQQFRGGARFNQEQEPALLAYAAGDLNTAARLYGELAARYRGKVLYAAMARLNLGMTLLRKGDLDAAAQELLLVERVPGQAWYSGLRITAATYLAQTHALRGDLQAAERWLRDARRKLRRTAHRTYDAALLSSAHALILCRQERYQEAELLLQRDWLQLEGNLTVLAMRPVWLLRALCQAQLGPREGGGAARWLERVQPCRPGEFAYLGERWPQLQALLSSAGL